MNTKQFINNLPKKDRLKIFLFGGFFGMTSDEVVKTFDKTHIVVVYIPPLWKRILIRIIVFIRRIFNHDKHN